MDAISLDTINHLLDRYDNEEALLEDQSKLISHYPELYNLSTRDDFDILTEYELNTLNYLILFVTMACADFLNKMPSFDLRQFEEIEDRLWGEFQDKRWSTKTAFDHYFTISQQEELLAIIEDTLTIDPDDTENITTVGKEVIMITIVALIFTYDQLNG